jgi:hypothetical protein
MSCVAPRTSAVKEYHVQNVDPTPLIARTWIVVDLLNRKFEMRHYDYVS